MARSWTGKRKPDPEPEPSGRRRGGRGGGRRRGEADYDSSKNASNDPKNLPQRSTHQSYMVAKGNGAFVMYASCYCDQTADHSRGEWGP